ncbi:hypothetical protein [Streptomyces sp. NPDC048639]|uniref:hypothetical protein n=1 Tax=Streptomyces sp. NPDC048639 TaxID=3365581 RepID=UPI00370FE705
MQRIATATLVVLALGGVASLGAGPAYADGPGATATGGSSMGPGLIQQGIAQEGRQNNHCSDTTANGDTVNVMGGRLKGRCVTGDGSFNRFSTVRHGAADAAGGSGLFTVNQQNTAQRGRQNNHCANANETPFEMTGAVWEARCTDRDESRSDHATFAGSGAGASGGSGGGGEGDPTVYQQNTAQVGRQNNACANPNESFFGISGGRYGVACGNRDASLSKHTRDTSGGAEAEGGNGTRLIEQNTAQEGRQNNACADPNGSIPLQITGGRAEGRCENEDTSLRWGTLTQGGGVNASGGTSTGRLVQQNTAQEGRQNNHCANPDFTETEITGGRDETRCGATDRSASVETTEIGGGAETDGGSSAAELFQQNTAQEGRQNNSCANPNNLDLTVSGGRATAQCQAVDNSRNVGTIYR